jgi:periplasmic protein CpxP/Spy
MSHAIVRAARTAIVLGLAGALIALPLGPAGRGAAAPAPEQFQLVQAGAPQRTPGKPPPAAPGQGDQTERQIADLQKKLHITAAQQPQFDAFAQVMRENAQALDAMMRQQEQNRSTNAVEALRASAQFAEAEAEGLKRLVPALQSLYDSLPDQQKRLADSVMVQPAQGDERQPARPKK